MDRLEQGESPAAPARLAGRVAIVTGAGRGIGRAIAEALGAAGAAVVCAARTGAEVEATARRIGDSGGRALAAPADVADWEAVQALVAAAGAAFGPVDVLVNDAGVMGPLGPHEDTDLERWARTLDVNVLGVVRTCRAVLPVMRARRRGKIINLSGGGAFGPLSAGGSLAYGTSKAAVARFTELLAAEVAPDGIQVNTLGPGLVRTRLSEEGSTERERRYGPGSGLDWSRARPPGDAARLAVWLASEASGGLTGRHLSVQGELPESPAAIAELMAGERYTMRLVR
jgi:NAD(P)-dependent dehydrogenase (short-subunit alcohol dehydrogenase family)